MNNRFESLFTDSDTDLVYESYRDFGAYIDGKEVVFKWAIEARLTDGKWNILLELSPESCSLNKDTQEYFEQYLGIEVDYIDALELAWRMNLPVVWKDSISLEYINDQNIDVLKDKLYSFMDTFEKTSTNLEDVIDMATLSDLKELVM